MSSNVSIQKTGLVAVYLLDSSCSGDEQVASLKKHTRYIIDYDKTFNTVEPCEEFIRSVRYERIFLIVTPILLTRVFQQNIHEIRHVQEIFIFDPLKTITCINTIKCLSYKIQDVFSSSNALVQCLWASVKECANKSDIRLSSLANCSIDATTNVINNFADLSEYWYPLFIDFLMSESVMTDDIAHFIHQCRLHFSRNPGALKLIDDFEKNYDSTFALSYYTRDGFIYRIVNRALRRQTIEGTLDLRFFLRKVHKELQSAYTWFESHYTVGQWMTFFRGQRMSADELNKLKKKKHDGTLITINSYFSTSLVREIALVFAGAPGIDAIPILFEIRAQFKDPQIQRLKPFAYIGQFSKYGDGESEVLFSVGSFFKIDNIIYNESEGVQLVQMTFIDENEDEKFVVIEDFRALRACPSEIALMKIGNLLSYDQSQGLTQAATFYETIINRNFSPTFTKKKSEGLTYLQ
ncbi:unnamed protein product [Adineta ricciae]|uniref:ADP ribosyltransferase domain-containing protein n=2 Tax=Adineta ricciae TaxID=249248 RepID=A0A815AER1_ADIRI|nr:unnamed protein product [Adineta ricciae]